MTLAGCKLTVYVFPIFLCVTTFSPSMSVLSTYRCINLYFLCFPVCRIISLSPVITSKHYSLFQACDHIFHTSHYVHISHISHYVAYILHVCQFVLTFSISLRVFTFSIFLIMCSHFPCLPVCAYTFHVSQCVFIFSLNPSLLIFYISPTVHSLRFPSAQCALTLSLSPTMFIYFPYLRTNRRTSPLYYQAILCDLELDHGDKCPTCSIA